MNTVNTTDELRRTAIHEAGHAVLHIALGLGCAAITIVPDYEKGTAGTAAHGGEYGRPGEALGEPDDDVANLRLFAEDAFYLRHAIANYGGAEAGRRLDPQRADWRAGADSDYREASARINAITDDAQSLELLFKYAARRCELLVEYYWPEITAVADLLIEHRTITGEQAQQRPDQSCRQYRRPPGP